MGCVFYARHIYHDGRAQPRNNLYKNIRTMHRIYRNDMPQTQKDKIAAANIGKTLSQQTKDKISRSMQKYWQRLPYKPDTDSDDMGGAQGQQPNPYADD